MECAVLFTVEGLHILGHVRVRYVISGYFNDSQNYLDSSSIIFNSSYQSLFMLIIQKCIFRTNILFLMNSFLLITNQLERTSPGFV